jgi:hypothetical protein
MTNQKLVEKMFCCPRSQILLNDTIEHTDKKDKTNHLKLNTYTIIIVINIPSGN